MEIKKYFKNFNPFCFEKVSNKNVYTLLKNINANKARSCDLISPNLVKIAADQLYEPLNCIINYAISQSIFPNKAQESYITPADKGANDTFLDPVSVMSTFSKIIELRIFDQITICADDFLSVFWGSLSLALRNTTCAYKLTWGMESYNPWKVS